MQCFDLYIVKILLALHPKKSHQSRHALNMLKHNGDNVQKTEGKMIIGAMVLCTHVLIYLQYLSEKE